MFASTSHVHATCAPVVVRRTPRSHRDAVVVDARGAREPVGASTSTSTASRRRDLLLASSTALATLAVSATAQLVAPLVARAQDAGDWSSPGLASTGPPAQYIKTPSGLVFERINDGEGEPARAGDIAVFDYVMRRANGYFIYGTIDCGVGCGNGDPAEYMLGPSGNLIPGLDELLTGMKPGEKKRALIKPELGYQSNPKGLDPQPPEFGQRRQVEVHSGEPMIFEVKLVKTRRR